MSELTVMIIDDDEVSAEILLKMIKTNENAGRIEWYWNGYEALVQIPALKPDLIFLDYMMPKIDGKEMLSVLNQMRSETNSYVAVVTAYIDRVNEVEFIKLGANEVLAKPVHFEQINQAIEQAREWKFSRQQA